MSLNITTSQAANDEYADQENSSKVTVVLFYITSFNNTHHVNTWKPKIRL